MKISKKFTFVLTFIFILTVSVSHTRRSGHKNDSGEQWWLTTGSIVRLVPAREKNTIKDYIAMLPKLAADGFKVIDLYAPYHGGVEYGGLDPIDFYSVRSGIGSFEDIRAFIKAAHALDMKVISFLNLGYSAVNHPDFIKACADVKKGVQSRERDMFVWADEPYEMERPLAPHFQQDNSNDGGWVYSEAAGKYYYSRWFGTGGNTKLPQYWFGSKVWRDECTRIMQFWREVGFDGFIIDAVNWYTGCDWDTNYDVIIKPAFEKGELFMQPEGAGGNRDEPVSWITKGHYSCVQDYSLNAWWHEIDIIGDCMKTGDASALWPVLESYRNRVVEAGGVVYMGLGQGRGIRRTAAELQLECALLVAIGEIINFNLRNWENLGNAELTKIFKLQTSYSALAPSGKRELISIDGKPSVFALRCIDGKKGADIVTIFNFGSTAYTHNIAGSKITVAPMKCAFVSSDGKVVIY